MKTTKIAMLILAIAVALYILIPSLSWAEDGTAVCKGETLGDKEQQKSPSGRTFWQL